MISNGRDEESDDTVLDDGFDPMARKVDRTGEHNHVSRVQPRT